MRKLSSKTSRWRKIAGGVLVVLALVVTFIAALAPSAWGILDPGIDDGDWNADFDGDWPPTVDPDWPLPATNPNVVPRCGIDIGVIIDRSGSIADAGQGGNYKAGVDALIDAFADTPSKMGLWSFANEASDSDATTYPWHQMVDLSVPANVTSLHDTVDDIPILSGFSTNWEEGLRAPLTAPVASSPLPEMWVVITDGNPTVHADDSGSGASTDNDDMAGGIVSANALKAVDVSPGSGPVGTKVFGVGVGPGINEDGISLISGPTEYNGSNFATADYITSSFADLEEELEAFALTLCGSTVTVTKEVSTKAAPTTYSAASGWTFGATNTTAPPAVTPASGQTNGSGQIVFSVSSPSSETLTITETQQANYQLTSRTCTLNGQAFPFSNTTNGVQVSVTQGQHVNCTFRNQPVFIDLSVAKTDGKTTTTPGATNSYVITATNAADATATATNVILTETVPANTTYEASGSDAWSCADESPAGTSCTLNIGSLAPGVNANRTFNVEVNNPVPADVTQITNTVTVTGTGDERDTGDQTATDTDTLDAGPEVGVEKDDNGASAVTGGLILYDVDFSNSGNQAATGVVLTETVPNFTTFDAASSHDDWDCNGAATGVGDGAAAGTECVLELGTVNGGASGSRQFAVRVNATVPDGVESIDNTVSIDDTDESCTEDCSDDEDTPLDAAPDLVVEKDDGGVTAEPGDPVTYTINYENVGDQDATGVVLTEEVPLGSTFVGPDTWTCVGTTCTYEVGELAAGESGTVEFTVQVDDPFPADQTELDNVVVIDDDGENGEDPTPENNTDDDQTPVEVPEVVTTDTQPPVTVGGNVVEPLPATGQNIQQLLVLAGILLIAGGLAAMASPAVAAKRRRR